MADTEDLIDAVRAAREADVAAVMKQQPDGRFKVSMRSKGATNVGAIAQSWGGGGHRLAAGYTSSWGPAETARLIRGGADRLERSGRCLTSTDCC